MIIDNKIQKTFSGPLVFLGLTFLTIAVVFVLNYKWILGPLSFILAGFFLFTYSGITIDTEKRMIKPYYMLFGFVKRGKWESLENYAGLTLIPMKKVYTLYSRSNRVSETEKKDFRVFLVTKSKKPAFAIKVCKTREDAQNSMDEFAIWLKMPVYSKKKY